MSIFSLNLKFDLEEANQIATKEEIASTSISRCLKTRKQFHRAKRNDDMNSRTNKMQRNHPLSPEELNRQLSITLGIDGEGEENQDQTFETMLDAIRSKVQKKYDIKCEKYQYHAPQKGAQQKCYCRSRKKEFYL